MPASPHQRCCARLWLACIMSEPCLRCRLAGAACVMVACAGICAGGMPRLHPEACPAGCLDVLPMCCSMAVAKPMPPWVYMKLCWHAGMSTHAPPHACPSCAADIAQAVQESECPDSPYLKPLSSSSPVTSPLGFFVPPPFAIAHHLMRIWVQHGGPWFSSSGEVLPARQPAAAAAPVANL